MKYFRFTIILIGCSLCLAVAGSPFNYTRQWQRIATLESKNLPQSALQAVDSLINIANQEKNSPQFLKGWLYRFRFLIEKDRDSFIPEIDAMEKYTAADKDPVEKGVLHSLLAKLYEQYYQQNRYTINQRTKLMAEIPADMKEWSANVFADTVSYHVRKSLEDAAKTQAVDALRYSAIIEPGASSRILQPTLYDFLCARAVEILTTFCSNEESNDRALKNEALFDKAEQFINQNDTAQYRKAQVLQIYRQWLSFRIKSNNKDAQLNIDLDRIQFVYDNSELKERDELYLAALEHLKKEYEKRESVIDVIAKLADYYREHDEYDSQRPAETYHFRDYQKRAFDFCEEGIRRFPNSKRINKLKTIELQIKERKIDASNPEIIANTSPLAITLTTSNTPQLEIRIYRIEKASPISGRRYLRSSNNNLSKGAVLIASRKIDLKTSPFFRQTDTTIILNSFPYGNYEYTVSEPNIQQTDKKVVGQFTVSNLAYFARTIKKDVIDLYVIDRTSGHPQKNGTVCLYKTDNAGSNQNFSKLDSCTTEINGHCSLDAKQNTNLFIRLHNGKDSYFPFNYINRGFYSQDYPKSNPVPQTSLFTDRAIYRPGKTVYFKGIAWQARQDSSEVIPGKNILFLCEMPITRKWNENLLYQTNLVRLTEVSLYPKIA